MWNQSDRIPACGRCMRARRRKVDAGADAAKRTVMFFPATTDSGILGLYLTISGSSQVVILPAQMLHSASAVRLSVLSGMVPFKLYIMIVCATVIAYWLIP